MAMSQHIQGFYGQVFKARTPLRAFMNVALSGTSVWSGAILDVGGTRQPLPSYHAYIPRGADSTVTCLNIDVQAKPDIVGDAAAMPIGAEAYDHAWCFNLLEHVPDPATVLREMHRVLRPHARIAVFTPFFTRIHGHPHDFYRYTDTALERYIREAGFSLERTDVIGGGPFLCVAAQLQLFFPSFLFVPLVACARGLDRLFAWRWPLLGRAWPLGYLVLAKKQ